METLGNKKGGKTSNKLFECKLCNYSCSKKYNLDRHLLTPKHFKKEQNEEKEQNEQNKPQSCINYVCEICNKEYNNKSGLWKHKQKCIGKVENKNLDKEKELITFIIQQFVHLQKQTPDNVVVNTIGNTNNSYNNNKTFNLQVFLNETCKDAMNIKEFADSVQLELSDLENVGKTGYIEGISNIIIKNLKALEVEKRPIHCTDNKREVIYIKDQDKWEKEEDNKPKLRKLIREITHKNICMFKKFREKYPDCDNYDSKKNDAFNKIVYESMGGKGDDDRVKENKIIHKISKQVTIDKDNHF